MLTVAGNDNWSAYTQPLCVACTSCITWVWVHDHTPERQEMKAVSSEKPVPGNWYITLKNILLVRSIKDDRSVIT